MKTFTLCVAVLAVVASASAGNVIDDIQGNSDLSSFSSFLTASGVDSTLGGAGPFTVWAPTNAAFAALPTYLVSYLKAPENKDALVALMKYHVTPSAVSTGSLSNGEKLSTLEGFDITVDQIGTTSNVGLASGTCEKEVPFVGSETAATNGNVQPIAAVLFPPGIMMPDFFFWVEQRGEERTGYSGFDCRATGTRVVAFQTEKPVGLAVDSNTQQMFWSNDQNAKPFDSWATSIDFSGANEKVFLNNLFDPQGMDTDEGAKKLYFTEHQGSKVHRCNYDGSDVETLMEWPGDSWFPADVAVDPSEELVFMTVQSVPTELQGYVAVMYYNGTGFRKLATGLHKNFGLCVDSFHKHVFYTQGGHGGSVNCLAYGSTPCKSGTTLVPLTNYAYMCDVDTAYAPYGGPSKIVFTESSIPGSAYMINNDGTGIQTILSNMSAPMGIKLGNIAIH